MRKPLGAAASAGQHHKRPEGGRSIAWTIVRTTIVSSGRLDTRLIGLGDPMDPDAIPMYPKLEA
jgi:hypothetical protein